MTPGVTVSDAGPIHYLILCGQIDVLQSLFGKVAIPTAVQTELSHPNTPKEIQDWLQTPPTWLEVDANPLALSKIRGLGLGESAALQLAAQLNAEAILMDDSAGRRAARLLNFRVMGTLAILEAGAQQGIVDLPSAIAKLRGTSFHITEKLLQEALARDKTRRGE